MLLYYYVFRNFPAKKQSFVQALALIQGIYYFVTGLWPIVDIQSFMMVTGPKVDIWLVKMVGGLTIAISLFLFVVASKGLITSEGMVLILAACFAYLTIDVYYSLNRVIRYIYLGDAALEFIFIVSWLQWLIKRGFKLKNKSV